MPTGKQIDAARRGLAVLRTIRGGAGKLAQLADFVDPGWAPPDERAEFAARLDEIRHETPAPLPFKRVERLLRDAWGGRLSNHLEELEPEPVAPATAGQVHRGSLEDGRTVAVKLLHPGLEDALRADLGNLSLLAPLATTILPCLDPRAVASELRDRMLEEMDLEYEAQSQRLFARAYRGHPFVQVPAAVTELARTGVLVSEWVEGRAFGEVMELDAGQRDRYGEILARFHVGSMFHTGVFHADPHPSNHLLCPDGRVAFLDFGSVGRVEPAWLTGLLAAAAAADAGDGQRFAHELDALGYLAEPENVDAEALLDRRLALELLLRHGRLPATDLRAWGTVAGLFAVLGQLDAQVPWSGLMRELQQEGEIASELGEAEAGFWEARGGSRRT